MIDPFTAAKKQTEFKEHRGPFIKSCPGTRCYVCCGYNFLNIATGCPIDCTYCILQDYLGPQPVTIHTNTGDMFDELEVSLSDDSHFIRIGTGELTDSLTVDGVTGYTKELVPFFAGYPNAALELKTKTDSVDNLMGLEHGGRTVVAWSLNPPEIIESEERGAASLDRRIAAAVRCRDAGYRLAFHFDPIIRYSDWHSGYASVAEALFDAGIEATNVAWISLGCLRFPPGMPEVIAERFPGSVIRTGRFITGKDGKSRYFKQIRIETYMALAAMLKKGWPDVFIYLCMESREVWQSSLGWSPTAGELSDTLDERVS